MRHVYGIDEAVLPGALDTLISRLRKRLDEAGAGVAIHPVRGESAIFSPRPRCDGATIVVVALVDSAAMRSDHRNIDIGRRLLFQLCSSRAE